LFLGWKLRAALYQHVNSPEGRLYLSRQLFEEAVHVQFYLNLLDTYVPDEQTRFEAFAAVENIPSIARKAEFCLRWIDSIYELRELQTRDDRRRFLLNLICFAACIEGLFFYGAFAYVYFLRSRGLLHGLASGTTGCSATSRCTWPSRSTSSTPSAPRSQTCSTPT
jgi:ribonucleoside-diphosphate reductase beta chain